MSDKKPKGLSTFVRLADDVKQEKFIEISKKVHGGEFEWVYFAVDGNKSYHYYRKLK